MSCILMRDSKVLMEEESTSTTAYLFSLIATLLAYFESTLSDVGLMWFLSLKEKTVVAERGA